MKANIVIFCSKLDDLEQLKQARESLFERLRSFLDFNLLSVEEYISKVCNSERQEDEFDILFIGSGGIEETFLNFFPILKSPFLIACDSQFNSMAAAFEICSWLESKDIPHKLLTFSSSCDDDFNDIKNIIEKLHKTEHYKKKLNGYIIGAIGGYSSWLIGSHIDKNQLLLDSNISVKNIDIKELITEYACIKKCYKFSDNDEYLIKYKDRLIGECTIENLKDSIILYLAIKNIINKYQLNAITIKCFDLISECNTTACLSMGILNSEGIVCGCEGDLRTLISLIWIKTITNREAFMANPSDINRKELTVDFAHCMIPLSMTSSFTLPTHFESNKGVGIDGVIPTGKYSLLKIGGNNFNKYLTCSGEVIEAPKYSQRCRTQVRFKFDSVHDFNRMINNRMGNHIVLVKGDIAL